MRVCLIIDKWGWAYDRIAQALIKFNKSEHKFEVLAAKTDAKKIKRSKADRFLVMGYQCWDKVDFLPKDRTFVGVHGHHQWDGHLTMPTEDVLPPNDLHEFLSSFRGVNVVSERLHRLFPYAVYTPNGVDTDIFRRVVLPTYCDNRRVVGCAYNPKHDWRKGVKDIIEPACDEDWVDVVLAPRNKTLHEMPSWYNSIDIYVCASSSEGLSLSVLEALACGRVIVSTIRNEINTQIIVDRNPEALRLELFDSMDTPFLVAMSKKAEAEAKERWSWEKRCGAWIDFLTA
jgi:glycosyltransferase involved in cell wall biosynthesis